MNTNNNWNHDLEAAKSSLPAATSQTFSSDSDCEKAETAKPHPSIYTHHLITTQREHFLLTISSALSVGLGLGSAVGIWSCIHAAIRSATHNAHLANWLAGPIMGFLLAPVLETSARLVATKTLGGVLARPSLPAPFLSARATCHRLVDHLLSITAALLCIGLVKGIQMQYPPLHALPCCDYPTFVIGFTLYAFARSVLYTVVLHSELDAERVSCGWPRLGAETFWEVIDHFRHAHRLVTVCVRDALTFAVFPYLGDLWTGYWRAVVDPSEKFVWVAEGLNIGFFFTCFSVLDEVMGVIAALTL